MNYEVRNGKVYEVKEVNMQDLEKEIKQAVSFINQHKQSMTPFSNEIVLKKQELARIIQKYNADIANLEAEVNKHMVEIEKAKNSVADKKEIIEKLFPNEKSILGF